MKELISEMIQWNNSVGLAPPNKPDLDLNYIMSAYENIKNLSPREIEEVMSKISSYNIYLKSIKGSLIAQVRALETNFNRQLNIKTKDLMNNYYSKPEREAIVLESNPDLQELEQNILLIQAKLSKIDDLPSSIDNMLSIIKNLYFRKINELKWEEKKNQS